MRMSDWSSDVCSSDLVDDLRQRTSVDIVHQQVAGLEVAMHHALLVRMLHALADADHQLDAPAQRQAVFFAELRSRTAGDELHSEERMTGGGGVGLDHMGDLRGPHPRPRTVLALALGLGPAHQAATSWE